MKIDEIAIFVPGNLLKLKNKFQEPGLFLHKQESTNTEQNYTAPENVTQVQNHRSCF